MSNILSVAENFLSIQGEGISVGVPSLFFRTAGCNLTCSGWSAKGATGEHIGCDSKEVWSKGYPKTFEEIFEQWEKEGWIDSLRKRTHLILTGGEPLQQQKNLTEFLRKFAERYVFIPFIEVETNCTFIPLPEFDVFINQYNVSPKLSTNGDPVEKTYREEVLKFFSKKQEANFKFVVTCEQDIDEILTKFLAPFNINPSRVGFMPEGATIDTVREKSIWLIEKCKELSIRFSPRLHISIWDKMTGV